MAALTSKITVPDTTSRSIATSTSTSTRPPPSPMLKLNNRDVVYKDGTASTQFVDGMGVGDDTRGVVEGISKLGKPLTMEDSANLHQAGGKDVEQGYGGGLTGQHIGNALWGLQQMTADSEEVQETLRKLATLIQSSTADLSGQNIANAVFGLQVSGYNILILC